MHITWSPTFSVEDPGLWNSNGRALWDPLLGAPHLALHMQPEALWAPPQHTLWAPPQHTLWAPSQHTQCRSGSLRDSDLFPLSSHTSRLYVVVPASAIMTSVVQCCSNAINWIQVQHTAVHAQHPLMLHRCHQKQSYTWVSPQACDLSNFAKRDRLALLSENFLAPLYANMPLTDWLCFCVCGDAHPNCPKVMFSWYSLSSVLAWFASPLKQKTGICSDIRSRHEQILSPTICEPLGRGSLKLTC